MEPVEAQTWDSSSLSPVFQTLPLSCHVFVPHGCIQ